jgi:general secretion pathway protein K
MKMMQAMISALVYAFSFSRLSMATLFQYSVLVSAKWKRHRSTKLRIAHQEGFILVSVIWIVGLIAVMATAFAITVRSHTLTIGNNLYNAKAEAISDGIVRYMIVQMLRSSSANSVSIYNGSTLLCSWEEIVSVSYQIQDQGGLVDVNTASPILLEKLFSGLSLDPTKQVGLLDALNSYKAPSLRSNVGSTQYYPSKNFGPKNQPLLSLDELDQIPGFGSEVLKKIRPLMTVYSQQTGVDPSRTPAALLKVLGSESVPVEFTSPSPQKVFSIDVLTELRNGARFHRQAMVALLGQPDRPFSILSWQSKYEDAPERLPTNNQPCVN